MPERSLSVAATARAAQASGPWIYRFREFVLDEFGGELRRGGTVVEIQNKPFRLLCHLVRNRDRFMRAAEIMDTVWPDVTVSEHAFSSALRDLRRALRDSDPSRPIVLTMRGRGYRFMAEVTYHTRVRLPEADAGPPSAAVARGIPKAG